MRQRFSGRSPFGRFLGVAFVATVALHCGGRGKAGHTSTTPAQPKISEFELAQFGCQAGDHQSCLKALASPEAVGGVREALLTTVCLKHVDQELCCKSRDELPYVQEAKAESGPNPQALALSTCGLFCFGQNGGRRFCDVFEGSLGEVNRIRACEGDPEINVICDGIPEATRSEIRSRHARIERERKIKEAQFAEDLRRRKEADIEAYHRLSVTRNTGRGAPAPQPSISTPRPRPQRFSCQYMFVTGGSSPSGWTKAERHFYDAPDCGGVCCEGQSVCCVDAKGTQEFCSETHRSNYAEPEAHFCRNGGRMRDARRDDYPVLPILPGEKYQNKPL
ncbi:MAG: hypothetical protein U0174_08035 [Polyangiaceae bacterium]